MITGQPLVSPPPIAQAQDLGTKKNSSVGESIYSVSLPLFHGRSDLLHADQNTTTQASAMLWSRTGRSASLSAGQTSLSQIPGPECRQPLLRRPVSANSQISTSVNILPVHSNAAKNHCFSSNMIVSPNVKKTSGGTGVAGGYKLMAADPSAAGMFGKMVGCRGSMQMQVVPVSGPASSVALQCRKGHSFTAEQTTALQAAFKKNRYIVGKDKAALATSIGLHQYQVASWFSNQRSRYPDEYVNDRKRNAAPNEDELPLKELKSDFTKTQLTHLDASYASCQHPSQEEKRRLASCTGIAYRCVERWFFDKRSQDKRNNNNEASQMTQRQGLSCERRPPGRPADFTRMTDYTLNMQADTVLKQIANDRRSQVGQTPVDSLDFSDQESLTGGASVSQVERTLVDSLDFSDQGSLTGGASVSQVERTPVDSLDFSDQGSFISEASIFQLGQAPVDSLDFSDQGSFISEASIFQLGQAPVDSLDFSDQESLTSEASIFQLGQAPVDSLDFSDQESLTSGSRVSQVGVAPVNNPSFSAVVQGEAFLSFPQVNHGKKEECVDIRSAPHPTLQSFLSYYADDEKCLFVYRDEDVQDKIYVDVGAYKMGSFPELGCHLAEALTSLADTSAPGYSYIQWLDSSNRNTVVVDISPTS